MGKTSIRGGSKNTTEKTRKRSTVALERTYHLKLHVPSKTYSSDYNSIPNYMRTPPRTDLEPWLTVRKSIISPILSPTLLQIYCIGLIGPISTSYLFWVWTAICDLTIVKTHIKLILNMYNLFSKFYLDYLWWGTKKYNSKTYEPKKEF